jgi:hypothetical protein
MADFDIFAGFDEPDEQEVEVPLTSIRKQPEAQADKPLKSIKEVDVPVFEGFDEETPTDVAGRRNLQLVNGRKPEAEAKARKDSIQTGAPISFTREQTEFNKVDIFKDFEAAPPSVKRYLGKDSVNAGVSQFDIKQLSTIDQLLTQKPPVTGVIKAVPLGLAAGLLDIPKGIGETFELTTEIFEQATREAGPPMTFNEMRQVEDFKRFLDSRTISIADMSRNAQDYLLRKVGKSKLEQLISQASRTVGTMAGIFVTGGQSIVLPGISAISGVGKAAEARREGFTLDKSISAGVASFATEYLTELIPITVLRTPAISFFKRFAAGLISDVPGELLATATEMKVIDEGILGKDPATTEQYVQALIDTALVASFVTIGTTAPTHALHTAMRKTETDASSSTDKNVHRETVAAEVDNSETKRLSPEQMMEAIKEMDDDADIYITNDGAEHFFQSEPDQADEIMRKIGLNPRTVRKQAARGEDITIKQSMFLSLLSTEERNLVLQHIKTDIDGYSQKNINDELPAEDNEILQETLNEVNAEQAPFFDELTRIKGEMVKAGRPEDQADANVALIEEFSNSLDLQGQDRTAFVKKIAIKKKRFDIKSLLGIGVPPKGVTEFEIEARERDQTVITLFQDADASTIPHELGHVFLREMELIEQTEGITEQFKADMQSLRSWLGVDGDIIGMNEEQQEKFARGWEQYLREGNAPKAELNTVFARFKRWLEEVYKRLRDTNVELSSEVREVFNRMLNADSETNTAAAVNRMTAPTTERMNELGIPNDEQSDLKRLIRKGIDKASLNLLLDRNRAVREAKPRFLEEAEAEARAADTRGVYDAIRSIKDAALFFKATKSTEKAQLNRQEFIERYGEEAIKALPDTGLLIKDGISLDEAAVTYEFDSADDMMTAFFDTPPLQDAIDSRVALKTETLENSFRAEDYLAQTKEYSDYIDRMKQHISKAATRAGQPVRVSRAKDIKALAAREMQELSVKRAQRTDRFMNAVKRAAVAMRKAEKTKDYARAIRENEKMLLNNEMAAISVRNRKEVERFVKRAKNYRSKTKPQSVAIRHRKGIQSLIERFGILPNVSPETPIDSKALNDLFKGDEHVSEFFAPAFLIDDRNLAKPRDYRNLSMTEFTALDSAIKFLEKQGKDEKKAVMADGETLIRDAALGSMAEMDAQKKTVKLLDRYNPLRKLSDQSRKQFARMLNLSYITKALGGYKSLRTGEKSFLEKHVIERAKDLRDTHLRRFRKERETVRPHRDVLMAAQRRIIKEHGRKLFVRDHGVPVPLLLQNNGEQLNYYTPEQIVAMAFNRGNDSNTGALIDGFPGLTLAQVDSLLDRYLTEQDMDAVQAILNIFETLAPETDAVHVKMKGYNMQRVKAREWTFKGKTYKGGYYPLSIDRNLASVENGFFASKEDAGNFFEEEDSNVVVPFATATHTLTRKDGHRYPVRLSLELVDRHLDKSVRYITMAEGIRDIDRIVTYSEKIKNEAGEVIGTRGFKKSAERIMGKDVYAQIRPALKHFVNPVLKGVDVPGNGMIRWLRSIAVPAHIALRPITGVKQLGSIISGIGELGIGGKGFRAYLNGAMYVASGPSAAYNTMLEKSAFMLERLRSWERDFLKSRFDKMTPAQREISFGDRAITWKQVVDFGYITVRIPDTIAVTPLWWGAYLDKINENGTNEKEAVRYADNIIEDTQPTAQPLDLSAWFREGGFWSLFNLHQTFTVGNYGQRQRTWFRAWKNGEISTMQYARFNFMDAVIPLSIMTVITHFLRGEDPTDEEEQKAMLEEFLVNWAFMGLPMATSTYNALTEGWQSPLEVAGARETERWIGTMRLWLRGFDDMTEEQQDRALWGIGDMVSDITRVPLSRVMRQVVTGETAQEKFFGKPRKKKK